MPTDGTSISRRSALKLSSASTLALLSGCLGQQGGSNSTNSKTNEGNSTGTAGTNSGSTKVRWLTHYNSETETFNKIIDRFEKEHPDVSIELRQVPPQKLVQQFSTSVGTSNAPDIWGKGPGPSELGKFVKSEIPLNLDPELDKSFMKKFAYLQSCLYESGDPLSWRSAEGSHYALPIAGYGNCYWYNKEVAADLGIAEEDLRGRSDIPWQKFVDMCKKAKDAGYTPIVMGGADNIKNLGQWVGASFYKQVGVDTMLDTTLNRNDRHLNEQPFVEAMAKYQRLYEKGYINEGVTAITRAQSVNLFYQGDALFYFQGSYMPNQINRMIGKDAPSIDKKIGYFWHPYYPDAYENGKNEIYGYVGDVMSVNEQSTEKRGNQKAAVEFFKHFFSKESMQTLFTEAGMPVARLDAWTNLTSEQKIQRQVVKDIKDAEKTYPAVPGSFLPQTREAFLSGIGNLFSGQDPQKMMDNMHKAQQKALKNY